MAFTEVSPAERASAPILARVMGQVRTVLTSNTDHAVAQRTAGLAFGTRVFSAGLIYLSQIALARWMGSYEFGIYVYAWTLVLAIGDVSDMGFATAAQRFVPEYTKTRAFDLLRGYIGYSRWFAVGGGAVVAALGLGVVQLLQSHIADYLVMPLTIALVALPLYCLLNIQDGLARAHGWILLALVPTYIVRHLAMLAVLLVAWFAGVPATAQNAGIAVAIGLLVTVFGQSILLRRRIGQTLPPGPVAYDQTRWFGVALPIVLVEGFYLLLTTTDIVMLNHFGTPNDVAVYYAAAKTLTLIAFVHFAVSAAVGHRFTEYHVTGRREELQSILNSAIHWTFWGSLAACVVMLSAGPLLLSLFGQGFSSGHSLMVILAVGLMARASLGPVERLLNMLGQQNACAIAYGVAFALNGMLCVVLIPRLGAQGAAIATSAALLSESVLLYIMTRRRLGLHVFIWGRSR